MGLRSLSALLERPRTACTGLVAAAVIVSCLAAPPAAAGTDFAVRFDQSDYIALPLGARDGLRPHSLERDGSVLPATTGTLRDAGGAVLGRFTVVAVGEAQSTARVDELAAGLSPSQAEHAAVDEPEVRHLSFRVLERGRYFRIDRGWAERSDSFREGSKGALHDEGGRVGALFTVVAVDEHESLGLVTEYLRGFSNHHLVRGETRSYLEQVVASTGFVNLTPFNIVMLAVGVLFLYLGIAKDYEPLLLVPIGFGILVGNIPLPPQIFNAVSVYMVDPVTHEYVFNTTTNSVMGMIYFGVRTGLFPPLIFLGIGALTDFSALLASPRSVFLGAAAQIGIFGTFLGALALGFSPADSAAIGIIGGADGPTAIFLASRLAPSLIGPIAIAAYSYMAMVPIIQPPIMKLLTTREERRIRMKPGRKVAKRDRIIFPIAGLLVTTLVAPGGLPLLGMLFFGNLLKESGVTGRLAKTASSALLDIATILLGVAVGASTTAQVFLTRQSILIFVLGCLAFGLATAGGVLFAKLMNVFSTTKINPLIGAAGVSAVPDSARVAHIVGLEEDPTNYLLQHALGPNVAGVIGSAIAAGVFLGIF
jgi:oxaloacetate decarboxylase beta subunit